MMYYFPNNKDNGSEGDHICDLCGKIITDDDCYELNNAPCNHPHYCDFRHLSCQLVLEEADYPELSKC